MFSSFGRYSHAIVARVPDNFCETQTSLNRARQEHERFTKLLRSLGIDVIELPADPQLPQSVFVEDTAFTINGTALICRPGHPSRIKEVDIIRSILTKELNLPIIEITDPKAKLDGGDILFTGREIFVGVSQRTNLNGALAVASAFPEFYVTPINVPRKVLHLKSCVSMAGPDILAVSSTPEAQEILRRIASEASFPYTTITVHDNESANVIYINGTLIHRSEFPQSVREFESKVDYKRAEISLFELCKNQSTLSSLCILVKKSRPHHTIV
ncbi:Putative dimethylarginine dimethylaminohydrolase [Sarcoptes scabiei]|uniref:Putative dimethylarginine dimethylaminohydrolase n=1 Tax=Sarcoptes scabiei TaxID=52283 RepID=A0A834RDB5_SARSC|nr:Putative dimethylarginine dimethylaminohydrolase [Sarcoptes scabiei]UXI21212.1 methyltransferase-like protein 13 [Sarcoptes scabiei]